LYSFFLNTGYQSFKKSSTSTVELFLVSLSYLYNLKHCTYLVLVSFFQNSETGEFEYFYTDSARVKQPKYDEETGEPVNDQMKVRYRKHGNFHVPRHFLRGTICDEVDNVLANKYQRDLDITAKHLVGADSTRQVESKLKKTRPGYEREDYIEMDGVSSVSLNLHNGAQWNFYSN